MHRLHSARRIAGLLLLCLALFFLGRSAFQLSASVALRDAIPGLNAVLVSALLSTGWLLSMIAGWLWVLRYHTTVEALPATGRLFPAFMHSFISRYVPGKVWPAVVLWERLHNDLPAAPVFRSYLLQQLHLLASAAVLSVGALPLVLSHTELGQSLTRASIGMAFVIGMIWALVPRPLFALGRRWLPEKWSDHLAFQGSVSRWALGFGIFVLVGILQGTALIPIWQAVAEPGHHLAAGSMILVVCAYATARVIGQGVAIVPAGIGVREGVFVLLVSAGLSSEAALISVLWLRLIATLVEFLVWLASVAVAWRVKPH